MTRRHLLFDHSDMSVSVRRGSEGVTVCRGGAGAQAGDWWREAERRDRDTRGGGGRWERVAAESIAESHVPACDGAAHTVPQSCSPCTGVARSVRVEREQPPRRWLSRLTRTAVVSAKKERPSLLLLCCLRRHAKRASERRAGNTCETANVCSHGKDTNTDGDALITQLASMVTNASVPPRSSVRIG